MDVIYSIIAGLASGGVVVGCMYGVIKTELKYLRRDIDSLHNKLTKHIEVHHG